MKKKIYLAGLLFLSLNFFAPSKAFADEIPDLKSGVVESVNSNGLGGTLRDSETGHVHEFSGATVTIHKGDGVIFIKVITPNEKVISIIATDENGA